MTQATVESEAIPKDPVDVFRTNCYSTNDLYAFIAEHAGFVQEEAIEFVILLFLAGVIRRETSTAEYVIDSHVMRLDWQEELKTYKANK
jgi:hypothetical protein